MSDSKSDDAATRMGRFRICAPNAPGPPGEQVSHGRFRIIPQSNLIWIFCCVLRIIKRFHGFFVFYWKLWIFTIFNPTSSVYLHTKKLIGFLFDFSASYGATSPCIQRGRFAVIPEEPSGSPSVIEAAEKTHRRTPSPDWDFTIEVNGISSAIFFSALTMCASSHQGQIIFMMGNKQQSANFKWEFRKTAIVGFSVKNDQIVKIRLG